MVNTEHPYTWKWSCLVDNNGEVHSAGQKLMCSPSHTFVEIDHEIIFIVILLHPLIQDGLLSVTNESMHTSLVKLANEKVWFGKLTDST